MPAPGGTPDGARMRAAGLVLTASQASTEAEDGWRASSNVDEGPVEGAQMFARATEPRRWGDWVLGGEELPGLVDAAQALRPAVCELESRARDEIPHGARDENFAAACAGRDPRADMNRDTAELVADPLAFPRVYSRSNLEAELTERATDRTGAAHGRSWPFEAGEEPVTRS